ncbi:MAG: hypothetical protein ACFFD9_10970 [Candidatus Thorarchaeota archaeon]
MNQKRFDKALKALGLTTTEKRAQVLGALLRAQPEPGLAVGFGDIYDNLGGPTEKKPVAHPLIYRCLMSLEEQGFIQVDRGSYRHGYAASSNTILAALYGLAQDKIAALKEEIARLESEKQFLGRLDIDVLSTSMIELLTGERSEERTRFGYGKDGVRRLVDSEIHSKARQGDIVRVSLDWIVPRPSISEERLRSMVDLALKGIEFRGLGRMKLKKNVMRRFASVYEKLKQRGLKVGLRFMPNPKATYQLLGRNNEGIILIVSEEPVAATWIPRSANPFLIDDAIDSFDKDYLQARDVLEDPMWEESMS